MDVRGLLWSLLLADIAMPSLPEAPRFTRAEEGDETFPANPPPPPPLPVPALAATAPLLENSSRGLTFVAVRVMRPDTAIGCDSLCCILCLFMFLERMVEDGQASDQGSFDV